MSAHVALEQLADDPVHVPTGAEGATLAGQDHARDLVVGAQLGEKVA